MTSSWQDGFPHQFANSELPWRALNLASEEGQRLEWLGDRVLSLALALIIRRTYSGLSVGEMTRAHSVLSSNDTLARLGARLELPTSSDPHEVHKSADGFEAMIGAVFVDAGFSAACACVGEVYAELLVSSSEAVWSRDPKSELKEKCDKQSQPQPVYHIAELEQSGFVVICQSFFGTAVGRGRTLRAAEKAAAALVLCEEAGEL